MACRSRRPIHRGRTPLPGGLPADVWREGRAGWWEKQKPSTTPTFRNRALAPSSPAKASGRTCSTSGTTRCTRSAGVAERRSRRKASSGPSCTRMLRWRSSTNSPPAVKARARARLKPKRGRELAGEAVHLRVVNVAGPVSLLVEAEPADSLVLPWIGAQFGA